MDVETVVAAGFVGTDVVDLLTVTWTGDGVLIGVEIIFVTIVGEEIFFTGTEVVVVLVAVVVVETGDDGFIWVVILSTFLFANEKNPFEGFEFEMDPPGTGTEVDFTGEEATAGLTEVDGRVLVFTGADTIGLLLLVVAVDEEMAVVKGLVVLIVLVSFAPPNEKNPPLLLGIIADVDSDVVAAVEVTDNGVGEFDFTEEGEVTILGAITTLGGRIGGKVAVVVLTEAEGGGDDLTTATRGISTFRSVLTKSGIGTFTTFLTLSIFEFTVPKIFCFLISM